MNIIDINQAAIKAKRSLEKSGQVGRIERLTASYVISKPEDITPDVNLMDTDFKWFSSLTPTEDEFMAGTAVVSQNGEEIMNVPISAPINQTTIIARATGAYCVNVGGISFIVSTVLENELGTLPKTGMYYSVLSPEEHRVGATFTFDFGEKVHPIDPKFIPGAVLPVVELTTVISETIGEVVSLTAEDEAKIESLNGMPCIITFTNVLGRISSIAQAITDEVNNKGYVVSLFVGEGSWCNYTIAYSEGTWVVVRVE